MFAVTTFLRSTPRVAAALLCAGLASASLAQTTRSAWSQAPVALIADDWCPQHCEGGTTHKGYVVDIVSQALQQEGVPFTIRYMPWARAMNTVLRGEADGLLTPTVPGFSKFLYHERAVGYQQYCFYVDQTSDWKYNRFVDLNGKRLAYLKDSGFGELDAYLKVNKDSIPTTEMASGTDFAKRLFAFLGFKRADAVIVTTDVYDYALERGDIAKNFKVAGCLPSEKMAVGLSPKNAERSQAIGQALDRGIAKLRGNGQLARILSAYGMKDWQAP